MISDDFSSHTTGLTSPARAAVAITPSDGAPLADAVRAIYVGGGGALRVRMVSGDVVDFANAQGGMIYPLRVDQVMATGTSATGIVGLS